ncbi:MAG: hypothetical protein AVDCRST_MAG56-3981, partial [uncultured Cytophagales bacterium]
EFGYYACSAPILRSGFFARNGSAAGVRPGGGHCRVGLLRRSAL